ncbi:MAG: 23S rRNA (pseudouridine(1915)-N(3))-methyltransferase RlmH [Alphaproteobacteria bacterium]
MGLTVLAIGRLKRGPETELVDRYSKRLKRLKTTVRELPEKESKDKEGEALLGALADGAFVIALDERGKDLTSPELAALLGEKTDLGQNIAFVIGGADGLSEAVKQRANASIRFGRMTWPHQIVRGLLFEQIYRAETILLGHPYHRV